MTVADSILLDHFEDWLFSLSMSNVLIGELAEQIADAIRAHFPTTEFQTVLQMKEISV